MFNPQMLTLAREAAGHTQTSLSHEIGLSQAYVSQLEHGFKEPTTELVQKLSETLGRPDSFFFDDGRVLGDGLVDFFHKKRITLPAKPLRWAHAEANVLRLETDRLLRRVDLELDRVLPDLSLDGVGSIENAAEMLRAVWRTPRGPLVDLTAHVESLGVPVLVADLRHRKLAAISVPLEVGSHLIVLNSRLAASDQRFALAHEVGHLVLHRSISEPSDLEAEADAFASELLLPRQDIDSSLRDLTFRGLGTLKAHWQVPMKALVYTAQHRQLIQSEAATALYKRLSSLTSGANREPGEFEAEEPRLIRAIIEHYLSELDYSRTAISAVMKATEARVRSFYLGEQLPPRLRIVDSTI